jgi:hypothetical protein
VGHDAASRLFVTDSAGCSLYTGVTRARTAVHLVSSRTVLKVAINQRIERASGLREALWGD